MEWALSRLGTDMGLGTGFGTGLELVFNSSVMGLEYVWNRSARALAWF